MVVLVLSKDVTSLKSFMNTSVSTAVTHGATVAEHDLRSDPAVGSGDTRPPRERRATVLQLLTETKVRDHGSHLARTAWH